MRILAIKVEDKIADIYNTINISEKKKIDNIINTFLNEIFRKNSEISYEKLCNEISNEAMKNGLTMEKLAEIMKWDNKTVKNLFGENLSENVS